MKTTALLACLTLVSCQGAGDDGRDEEHALTLSQSHMGWKSQSCPSCHQPFPPEGHSETRPPQCVACHGGNGACDPNGQYTARQHQETDDCVACHQSRHDFTASADCRACHFNAKGRSDCTRPPDGPDGPDEDDGGVDSGADTAEPADEEIAADDGEAAQDGGDLVADASDPGPGGDDEGSGVDDGTSGGDDGNTGPVLSNAIESNCFDWPATEWSTSNFSGLSTGVAAGDLAIEFTLKDLDGNDYTLSRMLAQKPVLMVFGAFT